MRVTWLTDLHLDHVPLTVWEPFIDRVRQTRPDRILITGDITEADDLLDQLDRIAERTCCPIDFVLGNHDYYGSDIQTVRRRLAAHIAKSDQLNYLSDTGGYIQLSESVGLVGVDGWGDTRVGNYDRSFVRLADFERILNLIPLGTAARRQFLQQLGSDSAEQLSAPLEQSLEANAVTIVATHVPPFRESCWYEGQTADDDWAPFFVCGAVGDLLRRVTARWPTRRIIVLCGHGHHAGTATVDQNITVHTAAAEYGAPAIADVIEISDRDVQMRGP